MPNCPGCYQRVSYERLAAHQRYCAELQNSDFLGPRSMEQFDRRLESLEERMDARLRSIEEELADGNGTQFEGRLQK